MSDEENVKSEAGPGARSGTRYPYYGLERALAFAKSVQTVGGNEASEDHVLTHLELSRTTKNWIYTLSSAREFGLVERRGRNDGAKLALTPLAKKILMPGSEDEASEAMREAFFSPGLYQQLFDRFCGAPVPTTKGLANILVRDFKLLSSVSVPAAEAFIESLTRAGLVAGDTVSKTTTQGSTRAHSGPAKTEEVRQSETRQSLEVPESFIIHPFQLRKGLKVIIPLPHDLQPRDVERLYAWMKTLPLDQDSGEAPAVE